MHRAPIRALCRAFAIALAGLLAACKSVDIPKLPGVTPYRIVIQQGNFISQEMVAQLKPGMTREQVRFVLGTPLVSDIFHADRWDYVYFLEHPNGKREQRNLAVIFEGGKLSRVVGDLFPSEAEVKRAAKPAAAHKPAAAAPKPAAQPEARMAPKEEIKKPAAAEEKTQRGFFGRLLDRITPGEAAAKSEPAPAAEPQPAAEAPKPAPQEETKEAKPEEEKERGFFGRMLEKIGL